MKTKIVIVILAVVAAGLLIALLSNKKQAEVQHQNDGEALLDFSNQLTAATTTLNDLRQVNLVLTNDVGSTHQAMETISNHLAETSTALADARSSLDNAQSQITNLTVHITDLESENEVLDQRANSLSNAIVTLNSQIAETRQKLAAAQTNNTYLTFELQKQMEQKAELERKFNDIDEVRSQVKKLRDEAFVARRLEWIREGTSPGTQPKGAQLLMGNSASHPPRATTSRPVPYDLNVEVGSDGSVHVLPPATNAPPR